MARFGPGKEEYVMSEEYLLHEYSLCCGVRACACVTFSADWTASSLSCSYAAACGLGIMVAGMRADWLGDRATSPDEGCHQGAPVYHLHSAI